MTNMNNSSERISTVPAISTTKVRNSLLRNFSYKLTDKKATSNFLKSASKEPLEVDPKQKCTIMSFSVGAYIKCVFPFMRQWEGCSKQLVTESFEINALSHSPGYDETGKQVDTVTAFNVNGKKVTMSCYHTTQRIKIEGTGYIEFEKYLINMFNDEI